MRIERGVLVNFLASPRGKYYCSAPQSTMLISRGKPQRQEKENSEVLVFESDSLDCQIYLTEEFV